MSETNSLKPLQPTTDETPSANVATTTPLQGSGHTLFERLGVGGMGEVYRCGDDALGRHLAIKILKVELHADAVAQERFLREARLTGSLQHPGVVPIHQLSRTTDGRPCYTMKLVRGRTFAEMLRDEAAGPERLPRLLAVIEKVCQAMAFAHSRNVIHRDLKPSNVMVGEFGEVQVMDWGLAKELHTGAPAPEPVEGPTEAIETAAWVEEAAGLSRAGAAMGTPAYMPPEQAAGDWAIVDERADVFALGAMLCEVLTGLPPYRGSNGDDVLRRARRGDMVEALGRLDQSGADASLLQLCRECLSAEREGRPRHAGVVAERLAAYQAEVQERLRRAEVERAAAEVKAREERKRRRLTAVLAALVLLVVIGVGGAIWWRQQQIEKTDGAVSNGLAQAELLAKQARDDPLQTDKYDQALKVAQAAKQLAESGSSAARRRAEDLIARLEQEEKAAKKDRELLAVLLDVRGPREGPKYTTDAKGMMTALAEPTADEQFAAAFRRWGVDVDSIPPDEAAKLLKARPPVVVREVIAALDEWASERRKQIADGQHLADLAARLDDDRGSKRRELREIMARGRLPQEWALDVLSAALRPVPIPFPVPLGQDRMRLRQLAEQTDAAAEPILGLLTLVRALGMAGEAARAEQLLRAAIMARPKEVVLHHTLGQLLTTQQPPRWAEAVECYAAARVARPDLGVNLAKALLNGGRDSEGLAVLAHLAAETPNNPYLHFQKAYALFGKGRLDEAMAEWRQTIALDRKYALAHYNLGNALRSKGQLDEAMGEYRQAIALDPKLAQAHNNLGRSLDDKGQLDEAMGEYRQAIALDSKLAPAHYNFGAALRAKGRWDEAIDEYRKAVYLDSTFAWARNNFGVALRAKGQLDEAMVEFRQAITLDPKLALAHNNLGIVLAAKERWDEAMGEFRQAIALDPTSAHAHGAMSQALLQQGRYAAARESARRALELFPTNAPLHRMVRQLLQKCERMLALDKKLPAILAGEASPANPSEGVALASMCQQPYQKCYAASARLYADAFAVEPRLAPQHRYNAACSAALAAAGQGKDARLLPDKTVAMLRRWALGWLRDDLTANAKLAEQNNPKAIQFIQQQMTHWRRDTDLASVRDPSSLERLADSERTAWQALWRDVDELAKRATKRDAAKK